MNTIKTLQDWVDQSPNSSPRNTLIKTIGLKDGRQVYASYHWNLRPVDPEEKAVYCDNEDKVITPEEAHAKL